MDQETHRQEETGDGAYWWFVNLFDPVSGRNHLEEIQNIAIENYDNFVAELSDEDKKRLEEIRTIGVKEIDDQKFIKLLAEGFSEFVKNSPQTK